jgi:hypothetical protein
MGRRGPPVALRDSRVVLIEGVIEPFSRSGNTLVS